MIDFVVDVTNIADRRRGTYNLVRKLHLNIFITNWAAGANDEICTWLNVRKRCTFSILPRFGLLEWVTLLAGTLMTRYRSNIQSPNISNIKSSTSNIKWSKCWWYTPTAYHTCEMGWGFPWNNVSPICILRCVQDLIWIMMGRAATMMWVWFIVTYIMTGGGGGGLYFILLFYLTFNFSHIIIILELDVYHVFAKNTHWTKT